MARGLVRMESDSGFCIWWEAHRERQWEEAGDKRQPEPQARSQAPLSSTPWASGSNPCPQPPSPLSHSPAAGRPGAAGGAAPEAGGSPRRAAHSPSSARVKGVGGGLGLPTLRIPPQPQSPSAPLPLQEIWPAFPRISKYPEGLSGTVRGNGTILWAMMSIRSQAAQPWVR